MCLAATALAAPGEDSPSLLKGVLPQDGIKQSLWEWDPTGRRDPFIFRPPKTERPPPGPEESGILIGLPTEMPAEEPPEQQGEVDWAQRRRRAKKVAEQLALSAFKALGARQYARAEEFVASAAGHMRAAKLESPKLAEKLVRLHNTARRLKKRTEIEAEFRNLKIIIRGIVWQPTDPVAVINDEVLREGSTVLGARVEEIRPDAVIFNFKGVRVSKQP